jgi:tripartite-type tricarboxylate transporter receptor subunit TctC
MNTRRILLVASANSVAAATLPNTAFAQTASDWPNKPIKFVVPYPPGGPTDLMARLLQPKLQALLGQTVLVDNRGGAAGNIGTDQVAKSGADGHTLLLAASGPMAVNKSLYKTLPFDPIKDLSPVIQISSFPLVLEVHPSLPVSNLTSFIAYLKANPGKVSFASAGSGTPQHLAGELFKVTTGTYMVHIPYRGAGPALNDVVGGQVQVMFDIVASSLQFIKSGRLKPLAVTSKARAQVLPDLPVIGDTVPGFELTAWHGIAMSSATPKAVIDKLNGALIKIFSEPEFKTRWQEIGSAVVAGSPESFGQLIRDETQKMSVLVKRSGAQPD